MSEAPIPLPGEAPRSRPWYAIAGGVWLLLVSVLAIVNAVALSRLAEHSRSDAQDVRVHALSAQVGELAHQVAAAGRQPRPLAQADIDALRQGLEQRISLVEQSRAASAPPSEVEALQARIGVIEARMKKTAPGASTAARRPVEPAKPAVPVPPFNVIGLELRGGERFLSVVAPGAASIQEVRLLREGDATGAWHLQSVEARAALFKVDGQTVRIPLP